MARRPSTVSVASLGSSKAPLDPSRSQGAAFPNGTNLPSAISQNGSLASSKMQDDVADIDPDELFTKYTIAEVKARQAQLRADAEAKQEDLRLMVGERYRDLLNASSSIISIATSAKRVQEALEETRVAIKSQRVPCVQSHVSQSGKDDSHLQTLQVLSAHVKLLLDAPEHLWRLIEREKYFQAAWLFLLARVVHRALIRDDAQDDESWIHHGIDVMEQFPLIQRQWETVSHFRTQIIHRATLSLRLHDKPCEETCATLLTLHILDSRPLTETLTIYFSQRTRSLNALLTKGLDLPDQLNGSIPVMHLNGRPPEAHASAKTTKLSAKTLVLAVKTSTQMALETISRTLHTAREVFGISSSAQSMARRVLDSIQAESSSAPPSNLPAELVLNTHAILNALPSSTNVSLLPANIRSYRPFVDLSSTSSSLSQEFLRDKLSSWFDQSTASLRATFDKWFASLDAVSAVWKVRSSLRKWVVHAELQTSESEHLTRLLDEAFSTRITDIWKASLASAEKGFIQALTSLGSGNVDDLFSPLCSLYRPAPVPQLGNGSSSDNSFRTYRATMSQRLEGRTPLLHKTLGTLEDAAASLQNDLTRMSAEGESSQRLITELTEAYRPAAQTLCLNVVSVLTTSAEELMASPDTAMNRLVFHARVANELSSSSSFVQNIGCDWPMVTSFQEKIRGLFERIMACWEEHIISKLVLNYAQHDGIWSTNSGSVCTNPSPPMMESLYSLSSSIHNLGMSHHQSYLMTTAQTMIAKFSAALVQVIEDGDSLCDVQILHDLTFLLHIALKWKNLETTILEKAIKHLGSHLPDSSNYDPNRSASAWLARTQTLISALLPPSPAAPEETPKENGDNAPAVLGYGMPVVDSQFVPAVELAPPSLRFPLLLVDAR